MAPKETEIKTDRLLLRRWTEDDMAGFLRFAADPEVMLAAGSRPALDRVSAEEDLRRAVADRYCFAITRLSDGEILGKIKLQKDIRRFHVESVSIGYELARAFWGNGYMTEALRAMVRFAFDVLRVEVIGIGHFVGNERSRRVILRAGFHFEGVLPRAFCRFDGTLFDDVSYSLLREEYLTGRPACVRETYRSQNHGV